MKKFLCILLSLVLLLSLLPLSAYAYRDYGTFPIYIDPEVDHMADEVLKEIGPLSLNKREQIKTVYDWIIKNCSRDESSTGPVYFNAETLSANYGSYFTDYNKKITDGNALARVELDSYYGIDTFGYDSNYCVSAYAYDMMMYRGGNCLHFSSLFAVLLGHLGIDCRVIDGEFINSDGSRVMHKWNYLLIDGKYYWCDIRIDHANYARTGVLSHYYYMVEDTKTWEKSHAWDHTYSNFLAANAAKITQMLANRVHACEVEPLPAKAPTCEQAGNLACYRCKICGSYFADATCDKPLAAYEVELAPTGHAWGDWTVVKESTLMDYGIEERVCYNDPSHKEQRKIRALGNPFADVAAGSFCEKPVVWAVLNKITAGTSKESFSPGADATRAQVVIFLWRAMGKPAVQSAAKPQFTDIKTDSYYYQAMCWAVSTNVTNGLSGTRFGPDLPCTRGQVVTFLWRAKGKPAVGNGALQVPFTDVSSSAYYYKSMCWAVENGITTGTSATSFAPDQTCTRGQIVTFLYRAMQLGG